MSLIELLDLFDPQLVFIDTFSRFVEGDENSSRVAHEFYDYSGRESYLWVQNSSHPLSQGRLRGHYAKSGEYPERNYLKL
jgi:hypothetical protein